MECALGQLGEDLGHRIHPLVHLHVGNCQKFRAVSSEMSVEKIVHEEHLTEYVDQVEELTEDELVGVGIVSSNRLLEVVHHHEPAVNHQLFCVNYNYYHIKSPLLVDGISIRVQGKVGQIL